MQFYTGGDLSSSLYEPLGAQQIIFPDLETITNLANNASKKRKGGMKIDVPPSVDFNSPPSVDGDEYDENDHEDGPPQKRKPGRKLAQTVPTNKRTAQNRAAQRAFRERKERYLKDLEAKAEELETLRKAMASGVAPTVTTDADAGPNQDALMAENQNLRERVAELENENTVLREMTFSFDFNNTGRSPSASGFLGGLTTPSTATTSIFGANPMGTYGTPSLAATSPSTSVMGDGNSSAALNALLAVSASPAQSDIGISSLPALTASPDDLFSIFDSPFVGLPDDLSFPLPQFPGGGGPSRTHREQQQQQSTAAIAARQRMQALQQQTQQAQVQAQLAAAQRQTKLQPRQSSPSAANLMRSTDLDIPVFDMDAFLQGSSPDDLDVFGDPINASNAASNAAAATSALLNAAAAAASSATSPSSFAGLSSPGMGFTALLQQQLTSPSNNPYNVYETAAASSATCSAPLADSARDAAVSQAASTAESLRTRLVKLEEGAKSLPAVCCENQEPDVIDELCEIFKTKAQCSEMQNLQNKILEACNEGDRERVIDLVEVCREKKRMYVLRLKAGVSVLPKSS